MPPEVFKLRKTNQGTAPLDGFYRTFRCRVAATCPWHVTTGRYCSLLPPPRGRGTSCCGAMLLEALLAVCLLGIVTSFLIQSMAASLRGYGKVRDTFEASLFLGNLLFEVKADERGKTFAQAQRTAIQSSLFTGNAYSFQIESRTLGETLAPWGDRTLYQAFDLQIDWQDERESVTARTVGRIKMERPAGGTVQG